MSYLFQARVEQAQNGYVLYFHVGSQEFTWIAADEDQLASALVEAARVAMRPRSEAASPP